MGLWIRWNYCSWVWFSILKITMVVLPCCKYIFLKPRRQTWNFSASFFFIPFNYIIKELSAVLHVSTFLSVKNGGVADIGFKAQFYSQVGKEKRQKGILCLVLMLIAVSNLVFDDPPLLSAFSVHHKSTLINVSLQSYYN